MKYYLIEFDSDFEFQVKNFIERENAIAFATKLATENRRFLIPDVESFQYDANSQKIRFIMENHRVENNGLTVKSLADVYFEVFKVSKLITQKEVKEEGKPYSPEKIEEREEIVIPKTRLFSHTNSHGTTKFSLKEEDEGSWYEKYTPFITERTFQVEEKEKLFEDEPKEVVKKILKL